MGVVGMGSKIRFPLFLWVLILSFPYFDISRSFMDFICTDQTIIDVYIIYFYSLYVVLFGGYEDRRWCRRTAIFMDQREIRCQGRSDELGI